MNRAILVDVYHLKNSGLKKELNKMLAKADNMEISFIEQSSNIPNKSRKCDAFIFEEDSFMNSIALFEKVKKLYKKPAAALILSGKNDVYNVVQWMRSGVTDYLVKGAYNRMVILKSIQGSIEFTNRDTAIPVKKKESKYEPAQLPVNINWNKLINNNNYELALMMFELEIDEKYKSRYTKSSIEMICAQVKKEIANIAVFFGGRLWYWMNNFGVFVFHFGNMTDCAVLTAIAAYNNFFNICLENLKLKEVINFKIGINSGTGIYHNSNTESITSDLINSLSHLTKKYTQTNYLDITENSFKKLNPRIRNNFYYIAKFENMKIYRYKFYNYDKAVK